MTATPPDLQPTLAAEQDPRPIVALPRQGLPGIVIAGAAALAALLLFLVLDAHRRSAATAVGRDAVHAGIIASPPPLAVPPEATPIPLAVVTTAAPEARFLVVPPAPSPMRPTMPLVPPTVILPLIEPLPAAAAPQRSNGDAAAKPGPAGSSALIIDGAAGTDPTTAASPLPGSSSAAGGGINRGPGIGGDDAPARASFIGNHATVIPVGTVIPAVLETPIDTARPGLVRAIVSRDTRGFDGRRVLVPRGSRLIGEYQADIRSGQDRVLVTWNRLIRPDGATIRLVSPTADPLGGAGVPGRVNTFFWQRFASALLQSALTVGVNLASRPGNGSVIVGLPSIGVNNVVGQALLPGNDLRPKIVVKQGAALTVFVARDLDFSSVADRP